MVGRPPEYRDRLWKAANLLRGQVDAAGYKHVVLTALFLRFASSGALRCPKAARWSEIRRTGDVEGALRALERANPPLRGALPPALGPVERAADLLALFDDLDGHESARDSLGSVYEYFLRRFARAEGRRGGQFYTPRSVVALLARLLGPLAGRAVYDPCCGAGGMFVQARDVRAAFGQESNPATWRLARMNLALHGIEADLGDGPADSFRRDMHPERRADVVLANPPFNQSDWGAAELAGDPRWRFGRPPERNANFAWLSHVVAHLEPDGAAGVVLANGSLSAVKSGEGAIRAALVEEGWVDAIVTLPPRLFHSTPIPCCLWILSRARPETTLWVDARGLGTLVERAHRELDEADLARIAGRYADYVAGRDVDEPGFSAAATRAEIAHFRHQLGPARYLTSATGRTNEPAAPRLRRLAGEWRDLRTEAARLADEIEELGLELE